MKQYITKEQLDELPIEQKEKLRSWWQPEYGDLYIEESWWQETRYKKIVWKKKNIYEYVCCDGGEDEPGMPILKEEDKEKARAEKTKLTKTNFFYGLGHYRRSYPLLSIGQMIEYLDTNKKIVGTVEHGEDIERNAVYIYTIIFAHKTHGDTPNWNDGLCDGLWEAVKELL